LWWKDDGREEAEVEGVRVRRVPEYDNGRTDLGGALLLLVLTMNVSESKS
jgi:hypothetical protein